MTTLTVTLLGILAALAVFGLYCCARERAWGVFFFALLMISAMVTLLILGDPAHRWTG